jgi:carbon storage regulator
MLVIRRRAGESLVIGDNVEVEILEIEWSQVKIGIRAPREVAVLRKEIHLTAEQNRSASELPREAVDTLLRNLKVKPADRSWPTEVRPNEPTQS